MRNVFKNAQTRMSTVCNGEHGKLSSMVYHTAIKDDKIF